MPAALLLDQELTPAAKLLYGTLQSQNGEFTYPALSRLTGTGPSTRKRAPSQWVHPVLVAFNPMIPPRIMATKSSRRRSRGSPSSRMPTSTDPTAPMPVQTP